jgi:hypothetical protein
MATGTDPADKDSFADLLRDIAELDLQDVDSDALREAEYEQTRWILDELAGKTIKAAEVADRRIVIETQDGNRYFFYGFMGSGPPER